MGVHATLGKDSPSSARSWAGVDDCDTPEAPPDPLRPVYWDIDELRSLATPAATARARRDRRRRDKLRAMVDADSAAKIDAAVDLVDARAARGNFGARARRAYGTSRVRWSLVHWSHVDAAPAAAEEIGRSPPFRLVFVVAALAALACRAADAVLVPGAHLCAADGRNGLEPRYDAWRDEISYEGSVDDEPVRLAPPVASSSLDLLFDRGAVGGRSERSLVVDGAVALVGEDLRLRAPPFDPRDYDDPQDAAKHWRRSPGGAARLPAVPRRGKAGPREAPVGDGRRARPRFARRRDLARAFGASRAAACSVC